MNLKNIFWNLSGLGFPVIAAALTIPWLIQMIGLERFGLLTIAWGMIGTSGLFDLGIGRATTQYTARLLGLKRYSDVPAVCQAGVSLSLVAGVIAGLIFAVAILLGVHRYLNTTSEVAVEMKWAALVLALTLPVQAVSATYRGINEAYADFRGISLVRIFLGVINFLGPFLVALVTVHLGWLISTLLFSRLIGVVVFRWLAVTHLTDQALVQSSGAAPAVALCPRAIRQELLRFGGWFTIGCGAGFILNLSERIAIGVMLSAAVISTFAIPGEVVIQSLAIVTAISTIAFPQLSILVQQDAHKALQLFHSWLVRVLAVMGAICVVMFVTLPWALRWWVGEELPPAAPAIGQMLCIGVWIQSVSVMSFSMIHANGRADLPTIVRLIEVPVHLVWLIALTHFNGIYGVAIAWVLRQIFDSSVLYYVLRKFPSESAALATSAEHKSVNGESGGTAFEMTAGEAV